MCIFQYLKFYDQENLGFVLKELLKAFFVMLFLVYNAL